MKQPLVSRPSYGGALQAEARLPEGSPASKGVSLDESIPGYKTFGKPVQDETKPPNRDESIYRVRDPLDQTKEQTIPDEIDHSQAKPSFFGGPGEDATSKTKYPYRDGIPNRHNASADLVIALWLLEKAPRRRFRGLGGVRVASTAEAILGGLDEGISQRSQSCTATLRRVDRPNLRWVFSVDCGGGTRAVKIRAIRPRANITDFGRMDLELSCSCPAWRWLGPEYHGEQEGYQLGAPRGTASTPDVKDPERDNRVCKHVAAALAQARGWTVPR